MVEHGQNESSNFSPENPFSEESIIAVLTNPKFRRNIAILAATTNNVGEGGFVVRTTKRLVVTNIVRSDPDPDIVAVGEPLFWRELGVPMNRLLRDGVIPRKDLVMEIHSHPTGKGMGIGHQSVKEALAPSIQDLEAWETVRLSNPHIIAGIVAGAGKHAQLLLVQADPNLRQDSYHQQWSQNDSVNKLFRLFRESGIRYQLLTFDLANRSFASAELEKAKAFAL